MAVVKGTFEGDTRVSARQRDVETMRDERE
jgi:hypothetical protein